MNRLKSLREEKGLYQKDIAKYLNCSIAIISMYEKGLRIMDVNIAEKLAKFFGTSIDYLLGNTDIRNPESIKLTDIELAFFNGIKGLNETNKQIAKQLVDGLIAKQKEDDKK